MVFGQRLVPPISVLRQKQSYTHPRAVNFGVKNNDTGIKNQESVVNKIKEYGIGVGLFEY